jgi:secreted trypsin-like serine protease
MKVLIVIFSICAILAVSAQAEEEWREIDWSNVVPTEAKVVVNPSEQTRTGRIVGGVVVEPHFHPYQAGLLVTRPETIQTFLCGGSLISTNRVLTAAKCVFESVRTQVILGAHQITANEPTQQRFTVESTYYRIHAQYLASHHFNDIAVLILPRHATLNAQVGLIDLAPADSGSFTGFLGMVSGWGITTDNGQYSTYLRAVQNTIISNVACARQLGAIIVDTTLCMANSGARGHCIGDAGSPLTNGWPRLQVGVASFNSNNGCEVGFAGGYSRVSSYNLWIARQQ